MEMDLARVSGEIHSFLWNITWYYVDWPWQRPRCKAIYLQFIFRRQCNVHTSPSKTSSYDQWRYISSGMLMTSSQFPIHHREWQLLIEGGGGEGGGGEGGGKVCGGGGECLGCDRYERLAALQNSCEAICLLGLDWLHSTNKNKPIWWARQS